MNSRFSTSHQRVLALQPTSRGVGYAVMEGARRLVDWGVKQARSDKKNVRSLGHILGLVQLYRPQLVIVEDHSAPSSRRHPRIARLIDEITKLACQRHIQVCRLSRATVRQAFAASGALTKQQIAAVIAKRLPELAPSLPPPRKIWMSEDYRMAIFDAVSFALTFFDSQRESRRAA